MIFILRTIYILPQILFLATPFHCFFFPFLYFLSKINQSINLHLSIYLGLSVYLYLSYIRSSICLSIYKRILVSIYLSSNLRFIYTIYIYLSSLCTYLHFSLSLSISFFLSFFICLCLFSTCSPHRHRKSHKELGKPKISRKQVNRYMI